MDTRNDPTPADVPSPIDFHDPAQARAWVARTERDRPYRPKFFERVAQQLSALDRPIAVAELGSGPGQLAEHVLGACPSVTSYALIDSSEAMLEISRTRLARFASLPRFLPLDFREPTWAGAVGTVDAVISMQSVHELRHKRRAPALYAQIASILAPDGLVVICDHVPGPEPDERRSALLMTAEEQLAALRSAGLDATALPDSDGLGLYRGVRRGERREILTTPRLRLREMDHRDLDFMASLLSDPDVMRYYPSPLTREEAQAWIDRRLRSYASHGYSLWLVEDRTTGEPLGQVGLIPQIVEEVEEAEIGYMIAARHWRRGVAIEAAQAVRDYAFGALGKTRLISLIRPDNQPSRGVARRLGMRIERRAMFRGIPHDVHVIDRRD